MRVCVCLGGGGCEGCFRHGNPTQTSFPVFLPAYSIPLSLRPSVRTPWPSLRFHVKSRATCSITGREVSGGAARSQTTPSTSDGALTNNAEAQTHSNESVICRERENNASIKCHLDALITLWNAYSYTWARGVSLHFNKCNIFNYGLLFSSLCVCDSEWVCESSCSQAHHPLLLDHPLHAHTHTN